MTVRTAEGTAIDDPGSSTEDVDFGASAVTGGVRGLGDVGAPHVSGTSGEPWSLDRADESILSSPPEDSSVTFAKLGIGTVIDGKYRVDEILGRGTMGLVVAATHLHLLERVALKFLNVRVSSRSEDFHARFRREAQLSAKLRSEHIARVIDVGVWQGRTPFMVMEYLAGMDLAKVLKARGPLPVDVALDYVVQVCEGLAEAHGLGVVHRDLKPSNLFITQRPDGSDLVKILDFGISKWSVEDEMGELTQTGVVLGSPKYMAVEHLFGSANVDARADVWSIGAIFYTMVCGKSPFDFASITRLCAELATDNPPPSMRDARPEVLPALDAALMRCFERDRAKRVQSVADLAGDLLDAVEAPFAESVRQSIMSALDPRGRRELLGTSSGAHPMGTGQYRALTFLSSTSTGAMAAPLRPRSTTGSTPGASLAPTSAESATEGATEASGARVPSRRRGIVIGALAGAAVALLLTFGVRSGKLRALASGELVPGVALTSAEGSIATPLAATAGSAPPASPAPPAIGAPPSGVAAVASPSDGAKGNVALGDALVGNASIGNAPGDRAQPSAPSLGSPLGVPMGPPPAAAPATAEERRAVARPLPVYRALPVAPAPAAKKPVTAASPRVEAPEPSASAAAPPEVPRKKIDPLEERQ